MNYPAEPGLETFRALHPEAGPEYVNSALKQGKYPEYGDFPEEEQLCRIMTNTGKPSASARP